MVSAVSDFPSLGSAEALCHRVQNGSEPRADSERALQNHLGLGEDGGGGGEPAWASSRDKNSTDVLEAGAEDARGDPVWVLAPGMGPSEPLREKTAGLSKSSAG